MAICLALTERHLLRGGEATTDMPEESGEILALATLASQALHPGVQNGTAAEEGSTGGKGVEGTGRGLLRGSK